MLKSSVIITIVMTFIFNGCGYKEDQAIDTNQYDTSKATANCELDPENLSKVMLLENNLEAQINCLEKHFLDFSKYVRRADRSSVSRKDLTVFIRRFFQDRSETIINGMKFVFELNMLFLRDHADKISRNNIRELFRLLALANREAFIIASSLRSVNDENYKEKRLIIEKSINEFSKRSLDIIKNKQNFPTSLNLKRFIRNVNSRFKDTRLNYSTISSFLTFKKLFIGGDPEVLTTVELTKLIEKLPKIFMVAIDLFFYQESNFGSRRELMAFYGERIQSVIELLHPLDDNVHILSNEDLFKIAESLTDDTFTIEDYKSLIVQTKTQLIGGDPNNYNFKDIKILMTYMTIAIKSSVFTEDVINITSKLNNELKDLKLNSTELNKIRDKFSKAVISYTQDLKTTLFSSGAPSKKAPLPEQINLLNFATALAEHKDSPFKFNVPFIRSIFIVKKMFFGGDKSYLTPDEIFNIIKRTNENPISNLLFDMLYLKNRKFEDNKEIFLFYSTNLKHLKTIYHPFFPNEEIFTIEDLSNIVNYFSPELKFSSFTQTVKNLKSKILGGPPGVFRYKDIYDITTGIEDLVDLLYYSEVTYSALPQTIINSENLIQSVPPIIIDEYRHFKTKKRKELHKKFEFILRNFRTFRDPKKGLPYYKQKIKRTKYGVSEVITINWLSKVLLTAFGKTENFRNNTSNNLNMSLTEKIDATKDFVVDLEGVRSALLDFKPVLQRYNLWSKYFDTFAQNTILLADLFQGQSTGDSALNQKEITEYGILVLSAIEMSTTLQQKIANHCDPGDDKNDPKFQVDCYRKFFYQVFFYEAGFKEYLPNLETYYRTASIEDSNNFLISIEGFSRDIPDERIPMNKRDLTLLLGALLNIESTFIRFDVNNDNIIDYKELKVAFKIYRSAILQIAKNKLRGNESRAEDVFYYMIKKMKLPEGSLGLVWFDEDSEDNIAKRLNIGKILYYLVMQSKKASKSISSRIKVK